MKTAIKITAFLMLILIVSCNKDFLNEPPKNLYASSIVWSDPALAQTTINQMYKDLGLPHSSISMSQFCDEAWQCWNWGTGDFMKSNITSDNIPAWGAVHDGALQWNSLYKAIRGSNVFLENVNQIKFSDNALYDGKNMKQRMKGEVFFLRAQFYHYLVSQFGSVPIITKSLTTTDSLHFARNTYEECINFIIQDLDSAADNLPNVQFQSGENYGRVTKGAALTLKSRVLLYAASDLHNPGLNASLISGYSNPEYLGYERNDATVRWQKAYEAAKAVMDLGIYSLKSGSAPYDQLFTSLFLAPNTSSEDIWIKLDIAKDNAGWVNDHYYITAAPNGYNGWGGPQPTSEMADSYEMVDGSKPDWNNPSFVAAPFTNRDPRFYSTFFYEGSSWRQRPDATKVGDPFNKIQIGYVGYLEGGVFKPLVPGVDTRQGPSSSWNGTFTGYNLKKYLDPAYTVDNYDAKQPNYFRWMRYSEVLLNRAEAAIELGLLGDASKFTEAQSLINQVRERVGMPAVVETGIPLRDRYRNERKVELAFEEHRFWDIRRWMIAEQVVGTSSKELKLRYIVNKTDDINVNGVPSYRKDDGTTWTTPTYLLEESGTVIRSWDKKAYFLPIMRDEVNKNVGKLIQNPGY